MEAIQLLIYDLDGTLADTRDDLHNAVLEVQRTLGHPLQTLQDTVAFVGNGIDLLLMRSLGMESDPDPARLGSARAVFDEYYARNLIAETTLYPGIPEVLSHFADRRQAVLSNKAHHYTCEIVRRLGIEDHFQRVYGAREGVERKPDPSSILQIITELQVPSANTLIIGDTKNDILAGQAAGVRTCAVTWGYRSAENLQAFHPDYMVHHAGELPGVLP